MNPLNYLLLLLKVYKVRMINMTKKLFQKKSIEQKEAPTMSEEVQHSTPTRELVSDESPAAEVSLPETALTYFKNANGKWQTALIKYNPVTKQATVESLGIENTHKEVVREEFILKNIHIELLT